MKKLLFMFVLLFMAASHVSGAAKAPTEIAGFKIGVNVHEYADKILAGEADKDFFRPFLEVVPIRPLPGYRSGYLYYGDCANPGQVFRIKLNYEDGSLDFYEKLLEALKQKYGEPSEWRGNAFGTLRTWKWSLEAEAGESISLILMYYQGDDGAYTRGNSIRLNAPERIASEEDCWERKAEHHADKREKEKAKNTPVKFDWFLPK